MLGVGWGGKVSAITCHELIPSWQGGRCYSPAAIEPTATLRWKNNAHLHSLVTLYVNDILNITLSNFGVLDKRFVIKMISV